jgi:hypothetical protein
MEPLREKLSDLAGPGSKVAEIITRSFGDKLKGKPLSWVKQKFRAIGSNYRKLIDRIRWVLENQGEDPAWSVAYCFLCKGVIPGDKRRKARREVDGRAYDQRKREQKRKARKEYDEALKEAGRKANRRNQDAEATIQKILSGEAGTLVSEFIGPSEDLIRGRKGFQVLVERRGKLKAKMLVRKNLKRYGARTTLDDLRKFAES